MAIDVLENTMGFPDITMGVPDVTMGDSRVGMGVSVEIEFALWHNLS